MANNSISYQRFTALPPNISNFGVTLEELALVRGKPQGDPVLAPMASPRATEARLALVRGGSDRLRMAAPVEPMQNPYEGHRSTLFLSRSAVQKMQGHVLTHLQRLVQSGNVGEASVQNLMVDSLRRIVGLREFVGDLNRMAEHVYVRSIAASKG